MDSISRQAALDDLVTFILDEVWDEELWELNWRAFPEIICRKMASLGYVKRTEDGYERLPAARPRKGKWSIEDCHAATYKYCCSECKAHHRARYDYCPTCGARMEE